MLVRKRKGRSAYASNFEDTERLSLFEMAWACDNIYCWRWFLFWFNFSHFSVYTLHNTADFFKIVFEFKIPWWLSILCASFLIGDLIT